MARLGDICEKVTDYVASGSFAALKENVLITNEENYAIMVKTADFSNGFTKALTYTDKHGYDFLKNSNLFGGELILSNIGSIGKVFKVPYLDRPMTLASNAVMIKTSTPELTDYLYYYFLSPAGYNSLLSISSGTSMLKFNKTELKKLEIPIPDTDKQRRIIAVMDKVSDLISLRKQQFAKLDELVKSRFVEMFGNPISNEMGWEKVQLSVCLDSIDNGKSFVCDASARQGNWPAVLKLSAATYGFYRPEENKAMLDENQFVEDAAVRVGDLLFTRKNTPELVGMCAYVYDTPSRLMMPDLIFRLNTTNRCNKVFLWKLINHELFRDCIQAIATGSAKSMSNISKERLLSLEIILPPTELQNQFATFVKQTDKSKLTIQQSLDKLETLKKALMQEYFG